jgi:hypothetical protein
MGPHFAARRIAMNFGFAARSARIALPALLALCGCSRGTPTEAWPPIVDPVVFTDALGTNVEFQAFAGSKLDALELDTTEQHSGTTSLRFTVPPVGDPSGTYAGGAFVTRRTRSFTSYNALSLWVKGSRAATLDVAGLGNDNTGTSQFEARRIAIPVTTSWTRVLVPIPLPERLTDEGGLFFLAEGPEAGAGMTLWIDDVEYVNDGTITNPRPTLATRTVKAFVGTTVNLDGATSTRFAISGLDQVVTHMPAYFTYTSSDPAVVKATDSVLSVVGPGTASITAALGSVPAAGTVTVEATAPPDHPAPTPTVPAADVISLFSHAYSNVPVDTWSATWDNADVSDVTLSGNATKLYTNLVVAGIEFGAHPIDATAMTSFHMDVWATSGTTFRVKLVDFGANGAFGGGDDSESELTFDGTTTPALVTGTWVGIEVPLSEFASLASRAHLAQLILSGDTRTVFVDNVYLHR